MQNRKNIRLPDYDYSYPGFYFVTICTARKIKIFSAVRRGDPRGRPYTDLTEVGIIAEQTLFEIEQRYDCRVDCHAIMPNHIHFVIDLTLPRATARVAPTLGSIVGAYKSIVADKCRKQGITEKSFWQRGYYEHVIRSEQDLAEIRAYIDGNPDQWAEDKYFIQD